MMRETKFKQQFLFVAIILLALTSCQKVIDLKLNNAPDQLVIEGNLTDVPGPQYVFISKSVPFTAKSQFPMVTDAKVYLTDSIGNKYNYTQTDSGVYNLYPFAGVYGKTYTLHVIMGDKTYTATSTMPKLVPLDSVTAKTNAFGKSNLRTIVVHYQDPPNVPNQYLFTLYINSGQASTIFTNDDSFSDGRYVIEDLFQTGVDIHPGDTALVVMQNIDKNIYKYWYTLSQQQTNGPGGGVTPSNPPSNFNNNALGYFSAHTVESQSIIVH